MAHRPAVKTSGAAAAVAILAIVGWNAWDGRPFPMDGEASAALTALVVVFIGPLIRKWTNWLDD